jgi:hypothetical protein
MMKGDKEERTERTHPVMLALPAPPSQTESVLVPPLKTNITHNVV